MTYATRADIETLYGPAELRLALDLGRDDTLSADNLASIDRAIEEASARIDAYLVGRYALPLTTTPPVLRGYAVDIALYTLASRQGRPRDELRKRFEDALAFLKSVSKGDAKLPGVPDTATGPLTPGDTGAGGGVSSVGGGRRIRRDTEILS